MARRGKFGRLPRQAPDLTGAIVALIREAAAQLDSNMVDAWKNGGEVDGKPATDERLLEHFKMRRDQLSPDDPLWDEWDNRVQQYTFSIAESKLMVKWENQKVKEGDVAKFYRDWMAKTPQNTEFYRELARNAGKWHAAARAQGRARSGGRRAADNSAWEQNYWDKHVAGGNIVNQALVFIAKQYGVMKENGKSLADILPNSAAYGQFLDVIDGTAGAYSPAVQKLINDAVKQVQKFNPGFEWTKGDIRDILGSSSKGAEVLSQKGHLKTTRDQMADLAAGFKWTTARVNDADEIEMAFIAGDNYEKALTACAGDPFCEKAALVTLRDTLKSQQAVLVQTMAGTNVEVTGPIDQTIREADAILTGQGSPRGIAGMDTGFWSIFDMQGKTDQNEQDLMTSRGVYAMNAIEALEGGGWVTFEDGPGLGPDGLPIPAMLVHKKEDPPPAGSVKMEGAGRVTVDPDGPNPKAKGITAYVTPRPITGMAIDPVTGLPDPNSQKRLYDEVILNDGNGNRIVGYRMDDPDGGQFFSLSKPTFANGTETTIPGQDGNQVTVTAFDASGSGPAASGTGTAPAFTPESNIPQLAQKTDSGAYVEGSYKTIDGMRAGAIVEKSFIDVSPEVTANGTTSDAYKQAVKTSADALNDAFLAAAQAKQNAKTPAEVAAANAMFIDAQSAFQTQQVYMKRSVGSVFDYDKSPTQIASEKRMRDNGFGGPSWAGDNREYESRLKLIEQLDAWETSHAGDSAMAGITGVSARDRFEQERDAARREVYDPNTPTKDIVLPGGNPLLRGVPQDQRIADSAVLTGLGALGQAIGDVMAPWFPKPQPGATGPYRAQPGMPKGGPGVTAPSTGGGLGGGYEPPKRSTTPQINTSTGFTTGTKTNFEPPKNTYKPPEDREDEFLEVNPYTGVVTGSYRPPADVSNNPFIRNQPR